MPQSTSFATSVTSFPTNKYSIFKTLQWRGRVHRPRNSREWYTHTTHTHQKRRAVSVILGECVISRHILACARCQRVQQAYVSIRQHLSFSLPEGSTGIRQHTSAYAFLPSCVSLALHLSLTLSLFLPLSRSSFSTQKSHKLPTRPTYAPAIKSKTSSVVVVWGHIYTYLVV